MLFSSMGSLKNKKGREHELLNLVFSASIIYIVAKIKGPALIFHSLVYLVSVFRAW